MANSARTQPGTEQITQAEIIDDSSALDNLTVFYEKNKKMLTSVTSVVLIAVVGYFGYTKMIKAPNEEKASTALSYSVEVFQADSLNMALNGGGDPKNIGFLKVAKKFSGTSAANLALYYEGVCYLKMGDYTNAIKALESFDGKGTMVGAQAFGTLGEAYMESGNSAKAIENFKKASTDNDDNLLTPLYLYHLGLAYVAANNANDAKAVFKRVRDEFPRSMQARDMDKELARLGELN